MKQTRPLKVADPNTLLASFYIFLEATFPRALPRYEELFSDAKYND